MKKAILIMACLIILISVSFAQELKPGKKNNTAKKTLSHAFIKVETDSILKKLVKIWSWRAMRCAAKGL